MEFLTKNQKRLLMTGDGNLESNWGGGFVSAEGKDVIVIGVSQSDSCRASPIGWSGKDIDECDIHMYTGLYGSSPR